MDESNIELGESIKDEVLQCLSSKLVNGILGVIKSQFNTGEDINNPNITEEPEDERTLTEIEKSASISKSIKRKRKGTIKSVKMTVNKDLPSCSKDGVLLPSFKDCEDTDETSPKIKRNNKEIESQSVETHENVVKKANRRRSSREFSESVVQNAIARKEMSFTQIEHTKRPSRPLKPTQKVLENLAAAWQKRGSKAKEKFLDESEIDFKKASKKSQNPPKNGKKIKLEKSDHESGNSDNESLIHLSGSSSEKQKIEIQTRRSRRISSAASKKDDETPKNSPDKSNIPNIKLPAQHLSASDQLIESRVCLCTKTTKIFVEKDEDTVYCEALDNIDGKIIGCSRTVDSKQVTAVRASLRIPYSLYCKMHTERLKVHNCCPTCGIFCTQGSFSECINKHQYHNECHMLIGEKVCCPHCGLSTSNTYVKLTLECHQNIINGDLYIPKQRRTVSSDKPSAANRSTSNTNHVISTRDVTSKSIANGSTDIANSNNILTTSKSNDVLSKFYAKVSTGRSNDKSTSSSVDLNGMSSVMSPKKRMDVGCRNPLEVSSITNLIPIQNLEQQIDESAVDNDDDFETSLDLYTISNCVLNEKYEQLQGLLEMTSRPIDLSLPFTYHLSPSCSSTTTVQHGTVLHYACALGRTTAVRSIVRAHVAARDGTDDLRRLLLLMDSDQNTPLAVALANGKNECANVLLDTGVCSITVRGSDGMSPLHICARAGNLTGCQLLLSHHSAATVHRYLNTADDGGWTALIWAAEHAHADVVALLLTRGADRMRADVERNVAAHWACYAGHVGVLNVLLEGGDDSEGALCMVNAVNVQGDTPLHLAAHQGHTACITQLLAHGAEPDLRNKMHETPLDLVTDTDSEAYRIIAKYLQQCSGGVNNVDNVPKGKTIVVEGASCGDEERVPVNRGVANRRPMKHVLLNNDISRGRETNPIQLINSVDTTSEPQDYTYVTACCLTTDNVRIDTRVTVLRHCACSAADIVSCLPTHMREDNGNPDGARSETTSLLRCNCLDETRVWYDADGRLVDGFNFQDPPSIFECNDLCSCNSLTCSNRVVQKNGSLMNCSIRTQVFRTKNRGWALRTLRNVSQGSYVCEYVGEVLNDRDVNLRSDDSYVFDLDSTDNELYCIDAKFYGNMSRFINHSCQPNLVPVKVFTNHQDLRFPRIAFFANQNIPVNDELSFDYGEKFWIIKYKTFTCECGTNDCKYSQDKITATLGECCKTTLATCNGR